MKKTENINFLTHFIGVIATIFATVLLANVARTNPVNFTVAMIYGACSILLFTASTFYHFMKKEENEKSVWRTLDHMSIYLMIAGTYTPICILVFNKLWGITIISIQWGLALAGFLSEIFWHKRPRWLGTVLYEMMGCVVLVAIVPLVNGVPVSLLLLLAAGGAFYSIGAIIYALKKPDPLPGIFGFHEIFHTLILIANGFFFVMIYKIILSA